MTVRDAYERAAKFIHAAGQLPESLQIAEEVERIRGVWRPKQVRVILLAESHVWTSDEEFKCRVKTEDGNESHFVRFVYCLGYGEAHLVNPPGPGKRGTPQYWQLFRDALYDPNKHTAKSLRKDRVNSKLRLLDELKYAGVWLVDASVTALYRSSRGLVVGRDYDRLLEACWDAHIRKVIADCDPLAVLVVGKGVNRTVGPLLKKSFPMVKTDNVRQPNSRRSVEQIFEDRNNTFDFCSRYRLNLHVPAHLD